MPDCDTNHTSKQPTTQYSQKQIVSGVKRIMAEKFTHAELLDMRSFVNGLITVASTTQEKEDGNGK